MEFERPTSNFEAIYIWPLGQSSLTVELRMGGGVMKSLLIPIMVGALMGGMVQANTVERAKALFVGSEKVQAEIKELKKNGFSVANDVVATSFSGGCGFVGCDSAFLVIQSFNTEGANTMTQSVVALANFPAVSEPSIQIAKVSAK